MVSKPGFRIGIFICRDLEIGDIAIPFSVFSVARRLDPRLEAFFIAETPGPVEVHTGFALMPSYSFAALPDMDAVLIPAGFGARQAINSGRLNEFIRDLPGKTALISVSSGSRFYSCAGALDAVAATRLLESSSHGKALDEAAPASRRSRARASGQGGIITGGGIESAMEVGLQLLRRAGCGEDFIAEVVRLMEYPAACDIAAPGIAFDEGAA
jgi:transcriptional regulator GlxA family with amidase domain